jgi:hypothetical protein
MDTRWFHSNLTFNADIFKEKRENILQTPNNWTQTSGMAKGDLPVFNKGIVENHGYEFELGWNQKVNKDFSYFAKAVYSYARNKIIEKNESSKPYDYQWEKGNPINQYFGYVYEGFYNSWEEIAAAPRRTSPATSPGDVKVKDLNGDGIINADDRCPIGYAQIPEITYSFQLGFDYKGFDFSAMIQGAARNSVMLTGDVGLDNNFGAYFEQHRGRWNPETAATATYPRFQKGANAAASAENYPGNNDPTYGQPQWLSNFWLLDGSYIRIKNIVIGYTIPKKVLKNTPLSSVRFYANGYNLFTWDHTKIVDPEQDPSKNNGYFYPQQKVYNVGVNVTF